MADKKKPNTIFWILLAFIGGMALCLICVIASAALLWKQLPRPETQTAGPVPQPAVAITAQTIEQVAELYRIPQPGFVYDVAWSPDGLILASAVLGAGGDPGSVQLLDTLTGRTLRSFDQITINRLAFSPDGQMLAAIGDQGLIVWNVADGGELSKTPLSSFGTRGIAFSPDSRVLAYRFQKTVNLLEMPGAGVLNTFQHASDVMGFAFLPGGQSMITAIVPFDENTFEEETTFAVWDMLSGSVLRTFTQPGGINQLVVAPDGKSLAVGTGSSTIRILELESEGQLQLFTGFRFGVPRFAFSPDGSALASGEGIGFEVASPGGLRLFDVVTGREVPMLTGHTGVIIGVAFSPDGRLLATASEDKTIRLWGVPPIE